MAKTCLNLSDFVRACHFAAVKHKNQRRKCVEDIPYINHPIGVAYHLVEYGITDAVTLCAAVLHDTVEDTDATFKEIEEHFGAEVEWIVREVSDDKALTKAERKRFQIDFRKSQSEAHHTTLKISKDRLQRAGVRNVYRTISNGLRKW
ncbi:guanosine-3',5'-bis(diphosphate) 3'-pyrophosphohydrolase MESH1-like isoform X2 [Varroa jacobsoni]|nr:guanosine-3',5'-bis(diphosphate) 3'-pyrophosphohydrolase MESH1-like isoform X2 [Varroa jacobsoni]XP_022703935.1 guanosine-3',5'-bis(diphosphate) 3'-pyrophosphohydrolase MESH1-like isoform X2 [Varroa jacobsoni]XP_022703936.1 guanosine-3',5'-bis(diphosphate) 3'-pyrophosphohydrolase MESH1-like isoform X2 [Varroa jacobsoni]